MSTEIPKYGDFRNIESQLEAAFPEELQASDESVERVNDYLELCLSYARFIPEGKREQTREIISEFYNYQPNFRKRSLRNSVTVNWMRFRKSRVGKFLTRPLVLFILLVCLVLAPIWFPRVKPYILNIFGLVKTGKNEQIHRIFPPGRSFSKQELIHEQRRVDVLFVHGLGGDYETTWHPAENENEYWPAKVAEEFAKDNVGVFSMDYDAHGVDFSGSRGRTLEELSATFLSLLETAHDQHDLGKHCPVVFVTHSLGGLIVKQALYVAERDERQFMKDMQISIVFLATPHEGSDTANFVLKLPVEGTTTLRALTSNNEKLKAIQAQFRRIAENPLRKIATKSFYEMKPLLPITTELVVTKDSADPKTVGNQHLSVAQADHNSICKPTDQNPYVRNEVNKFIKRQFGFEPPKRVPPIWRLRFEVGEEQAERYISPREDVSISASELSIRNSSNRDVALFVWKCAQKSDIFIDPAQEFAFFEIKSTDQRTTLPLKFDPPSQSGFVCLWLMDLTVPNSKIVFWRHVDLTAHSILEFSDEEFITRSK